MTSSCSDLQEIARSMTLESETAHKAVMAIGFDTRNLVINADHKSFYLVDVEKAKVPPNYFAGFVL